MKVHPVPRKRNITLIRYDVPSQAGSLASRQKKLRRLPNIFAKVLELPFHSDADVSIMETSDFLKFVVPTTEEVFADDVRAHTVEIHPGVSKIVIRGNHADVGDLLLEELELDMWRIRLPAYTRPDLATAAYSDGELVVLVPKSGGEEEVDDEHDSVVTVEGGHRCESGILLRSTWIWMSTGSEADARKHKK